MTAPPAEPAPAGTDPILSSDRPLIPWMLSFLRPHRSRVTLLAFLLVSQIVLSALQPWPLKVVIDNVLNYQNHPLPEPVNGWLGALSGGNMVVTLAIVVFAGVVLQLLNEAAAAYGTKVQVDTGQRMVYELRSRLFQHLQALGLNHHITTNTGDAVYRIDVDSYAIENLVMSGIFPLATSVATLGVMFVDPAQARSDRGAAVVVGRAVPVSVPALLHEHHRGAERAGQRARVQSHRPPLRGLQRDPAGQELCARAVRDAALHELRHRSDERAHRDHLAGVALRPGGGAGDDSRHRAGRHRRRQPCAQRPHDRGRADRRHRLSGRGLRSVGLDRAHHRQAERRDRGRPSRAGDVQPAAGDR